MINEALSNEVKECIFNITSNSQDLNNNQSSSLNDLDYHLIAHPSVYISKKITVKTNTMKNIIIEKNINMNNYDFINIDTQGSELEILKGFEEYLDNIKYIYAEINVKKLYKDIALLSELDDYLYKKALKDFNSYGRTIFNVYYFTCIKIICEKYNRIEKLKRVLL